MSLSSKIREARQHKNLTQEQLAEKIGVSNNAISNWEHDVSKPDIDKIIKLCIALEVDPNYLLDYKNKIIKENNDIDVFNKIIKFLQLNKDTILK